MSGRDICLLVFDGLADWEPSFALTGLRRWASMSVRTVGFSAAPVTTMGGLRLLPDATLAQVDAGGVALFMLPGGDMWENDYPRAQLEPVLGELRARQVPIAAICGATVALARAGLLAGRRHTSNGREYLLAHAPGYAGAEHYEEGLAMRDDGIITASGLGAVEFAREIFAELQAFSADDIALFYEMYRHGRMPAGTA
jgi:putative intracellular protease/amidase